MLSRAIISALMLVAAPCAADGFVVVKHAANGTASVSKAELKAMLLGRTKTWAGAGPVQVELPEAESAAVTAMAQEVFGVPESVVRSKMKQEVFRGELRKPTSCADEAACVAAVKADKGGLAIVSPETAASLPAGVSTLKVTN